MKRTSPTSLPIVLVALLLALPAGALAQGASADKYDLRIPSAGGGQPAAGAGADLRELGAGPTGGLRSAGDPAPPGVGSRASEPGSGMGLALPILIALAVLAAAAFAFVRRRPATAAPTF